MLKAELLTAGRAAWPTVRVDEDELERFLVERGDAQAPAADLYLACALARGDDEALDRFEARYLSEVPSYLSRLDGGATLADDVRQLLRERLFVAAPGQRRKIVEYGGRGTLASWLRVVALRIGLELLRARKPERAIDELESLASSADPELQVIQARYAHEFAQAFTDAVAALEPRARTVLKLYVIDGLNIDRIGALYDVHRTTVARWIADTRAALFDDTRRRLAERLRLDASEFHSLLRVVRSQLDVSIRRLLAS
jgi:RNA polymerase sigma-70 factor (ECF subfamily)